MSEICESVDTPPPPAPTSTTTPPPPPAPTSTTTPPPSPASTQSASSSNEPPPSSSPTTSPTPLESSSDARATSSSPPLESTLPTAADDASKDRQLESELEKEKSVSSECKKAEDSLAATAVVVDDAACDDGENEKSECKMAEDSVAATVVVDKNVACAVDEKEKLVSSECQKADEKVDAIAVVDDVAYAVDEKEKLVSSKCEKAEEAVATTAVVVDDVACAVDEKLTLQVENLTTTETANLIASTTVSDDNTTLLTTTTTTTPSNNAPETESTTQIPAANTATSTAASTPTTDSTIPTTADTTLSFTPSPASTPDERRVSVVEKKCNFLRQFRSGSSGSGFKRFTASQFMEVWNHYDTDGNGYIEDHELDGFLKEFVLSSVSENDNRPEILSDAAMSLFKETFMDAFDENQDGMIDISELAEILPTDENFLLLFHLKNPLQSSVEFMKIWRVYDKDCQGFIESKELKSFLKHILDNQKTTVSEDKLNEYTETILNLFDSNRDGKLQLSEMARLMPVKQNFLSKPILKGAGCLTRRDIDKLFRIYDQNRNGTIEDEELTGLLKDIMDLGKKDYTLDDINKMKKIIMDHWDQDHDGTISKSELRMFLIQQCKISAESQGLPYNDEGGSDDDDDYD